MLDAMAKDRRPRPSASKLGLFLNGLQTWCVRHRWALMRQHARYSRTCSVYYPRRSPADPADRFSNTSIAMPIGVKHSRFHKGPISKFTAAVECCGATNTEQKMVMSEISMAIAPMNRPPPSGRLRASQFSVMYGAIDNTKRQALKNRLPLPKPIATEQCSAVPSNSSKGNVLFSRRSAIFIPLVNMSERRKVKPDAGVGPHSTTTD